MRLILYASLILFPLSMLAQQTPSGKFKIIGLIADSENQPVSFGNAAVFDPSDSSLVSGAVSDDNGNFEIAVAPGKYYVKVSYISFEEKIISDVNVTNRDVNLGVVRLTDETDVLDEVLIQGSRGQMQLDLDKRVFNVTEDPSNISRNAADILDNIPSVSVDVDGNVSLR